MYTRIRIDFELSIPCEDYVRIQDIFEKWRSSFPIDPYSCSLELFHPKFTALLLQRQNRTHQLKIALARYLITALGTWRAAWYFENAQVRRRRHRCRISWKMSDGDFLIWVSRLLNPKLILRFWHETDKMNQSPPCQGYSLRVYRHRGIARGLVTPKLYKN